MSQCNPQASGAQRADAPDLALQALARLLGRQAAREAIRAVRDDAQVSDPAPATPATTTDEE